MARSRHSRLSYLRRLWSAGPWARIIGAAWTAIGIAILFRDDFLSPEQQAKLKGPVVAHLLSWEVWTVAALLIVIGWLFEASFRSHRRIVGVITDTETARDKALADLGSLREAQREFPPPGGP